MTSASPQDDDPWASFGAAFGEPPEAPPPSPDVQSPPQMEQPVASLGGLAERSAPAVPDEELAGMLSQLEDLFPAISSSLPRAAALPCVESLSGVNSFLGALSRPGLPKGPAPLVPQARTLPVPGLPVHSSPIASLMQMPVSLASAVGNVRLEYRGSSSLKVNHRAVLTLRLHATESSSRCHVCVKSSMFEAPQEFPINCPTPGQYEITTLRLSPREAGDHDVQFELTVARPAKATSSQRLSSSESVRCPNGLRRRTSRRRQICLCEGGLSPSRGSLSPHHRDQGTIDDPSRPHVPGSRQWRHVGMGRTSCRPDQHHSCTGHRV